MTTRPPSFAPSNPPRRPQLPAEEGAIPAADQSDDAGESAALDVVAPSDGRVSVPGVSRPAERVSGQFADRLAERQRARRRLRIRGLVIGAVVAVLLAGAGYVGWVSPVLELRSADVTVSGANSIVSADQVLAVITPLEGDPLLRINTGGLRDDILAAVPGLIDVEITRDWPHGLQVGLTPRVPVATVASGEQFVLLDADGVELVTVDAPVEGVPLVQVPVGTDTTADSLTAVLAALTALSDAGLLDQVSAASASSPFQVQLTLASGSTVIWGSADDSDLKAAVLQTLLQVPAAVYDVSAPQSPITRT